jgi:enterochelin esterase family protein
MDERRATLAFLLAAETGPPPAVSPEVHADRTVTFRIQAPRAAEVTFNGDWLTATSPS